MARVTAAEYAEKHARRLKASTEDIRKGISRVSVAPGVQAAKSAQLMLQKIMEAVNSGMWAAQVSSVSLEDWKRAATEKGIGRIAAGIDAAQPRQIQMAEKLLAAVDASAAKVNSMPKGTLEDSIARMTTFAREMSSRKVRGTR